MKAVVMAGGAGTRLRPLTSNIPKPMMPLANRPMIEHVLELLKQHGFSEVVITVAFMANAIRNWFGDGTDFGLRIVYATEETPLGTAGSVRNAMDELTETFLVISGDVLTDIDLTKIVSDHHESRATATIGLIRVDDPLEFGIVTTDDEGMIEDFMEKPGWGQVFSDTINTGIFVLEPEIFDYIESGRPVDFSGEVFPALLAAGRPIRGSVGEGYWADVGALDSYLGAHADILDGTVAAGIGGFEIRDGVFLGEHVSIDPSAVIEGPAVIGDDCRIGAGVRIGPYSVLGANVRVRSDASLERSVVHANTYLAQGVSLRGAVVGRSCDLRGRVRAEPGVVIGDDCFIGEGASLTTDVKVYPFKTIEAGATINSSIVWETRGAQRLFSQLGVRGISNVDVTPELAARVAMAYGSTLRSGDTVITSRDSSRSARMLKRAVQAGLNATGVSIQDLEAASTPVTRFVTRRPTIAGAVTVRLDEQNPEIVTIHFLNGSGADLDEAGQRRIERVFNREDYRRAPAAEIGNLEFVPRALEHYAVAVESTIDMAKVDERRFKIVCDYGYSSVSFVMPNLMAKLGADVLAINPYASTAGMAGFDRASHSGRVAELVTASGSDIGVLFTPGGEQLTVVDSTGRVLDDHQSLLTFVALHGKALDGARVAVPVSAPQAVDRITAERGGLVLRTGTSAAAIMEAAADPLVCLAADVDGRFIAGDLMPAFDAAGAFVSLLDLLATANTDLATVVDSLPEVHLARRRVITPWDRKGTVMRVLREQSKDRRVDLVDGLRIHHRDGWALVLPDVDEPMVQVLAEGSDAAGAEALADEYARRVAELVRS